MLVKESHIRRRVRVKFRLLYNPCLYILLGLFIVLKKKELIGSFSLSLNSGFHYALQLSPK